jgi:hypothetical protein
MTTSLAAPLGAILAPGRGGVMTNYRLSEYDKKKIEEDRQANLAGFWIIFFIIAAGLALYFGTQAGM